MANITLVSGSLLFAFLLYRFLIFPAFLSPLAKIPNAHFTAPLSPLWILWVRKQFRENKTIHAAHQKLGPIVRLGPNEISVACVDEGVRTIYPGGFEKHDWYPRMFDNFGVPNMFSTAASRSHSVRKRMVSHIYSKSYIQASEDLRTVSHTMLYDRLLPIIDEHARDSKPLDVLSLNYAATMDWINAYVFGVSAGSNFMQDVPARKEFLELYHSRQVHTYYPQELPGLMRFMKRLGFHLVPLWVDAANQALEAWCMNMCTTATEQLSEKTSSTPPVVFSQLSDSLKRSSKESLSGPEASHELAVASELFDHIAAGHETSGITLTYLMYEMSLHPELQRALRSELSGLSPQIRRPQDKEKHAASQHELPAPREIDGLPLLHAILMETLRKHAAIPGPQPRITPYPSCSLAGVDNIPANVRVSSLAYTLHRNAQVFPEPEKWAPERWLEADEAKKAEMGRWFWAFGSGGRMCVGSNFAVQEMKLIAAAIYSNYETAIVDASGIEQVDMYTAGPSGKEILLGFRRVATQ